MPAGGAARPRTADDDVTDAVPIQYVKGVGPRIAERLAARGIRTVADALLFFPKGYEDRRRIVPAAALRPGMTVPVRGRVVRVAGGGPGAFGPRRVLEVTVSDGTGVVSAKWFRAHPSLAQRFRPGEEVVLCGTVRAFRSALEMHHPEVLPAAVGRDPAHLGAIVPVYPEVEGVPARVLRRIQREVVTRYAPSVREFFPAWMLARAGVPPLHESLAAVHFPPDDADAALLLSFSSPQQQRLVFQELFLVQWRLARRRAGAAREEALPLPWDRQIVEEIKRRLPFALTDAQRRAVNEILKDMARPHPMQRLLQGDVGSGKTVVAWIAAMVAWRNGAQAAVMAPTEILAEQHHARFAALCRGLPVRVVLLTSAVAGRQRDEILAGIADGSAHIVIGTHALIQEGVRFRQMALGIVDEQHRFGVLQRAALRGKGRKAPHLLVMTATPIPRTLAMTLYGDLDVSVIDRMPPGRVPVETHVTGEGNREMAWERVRREIAQGGRAYVIVPLVEESERLTLRDAARTAEEVRRLLPGAGVALLHGRMRPAEKEEALRRFQAGDARVLVSTTVVEVGIDVPEATAMVVLDADRFGLAQLHQLRGRVGRGGRPGVCFLCPGRDAGEEALARLAVMERCQDGFRIAEEDLRIRGPGDFAGIRQSGIPDLVFSDLVRDARMLATARRIAAELMARDPELRATEHRALARWLEERGEGTEVAG